MRILFSQRSAGREVDLVARARTGDLDAFERLVARHRARLFRIARRFVGDPDAAQDLVQEGLVKALRSLSSLRDDEHFGAWLGTIVRRVGLEHLREGRRRPESVAEEALLEVAGAASPDEVRELMERVQAALSVLPPRDRQVLVLHYLEGLSYQEIAAHLGLPLGSVRRILHTSRLRVRETVRAQAEELDAPRGPRPLRYWVDELPAPGQPGVAASLHSSLAQSICLALNKRAKTPAQLAAQVEAHPRYVRETIRGLTAAGLLGMPSRGKHQTRFLALDAEDWRRLLRVVAEPAAQVAERFAAAEPALQEAFAATPLAAAGWPWRDVAWVMYGGLVANIAVGQWERRGAPWSPPTPGGLRPRVGGHELEPNLPPMWGTQLRCLRASTRVAYGCLHNWYWRYARVSATLGAAGMAQVDLLCRGVRTERELCPAWTAEQRAALADLQHLGIVARENGHYRLQVPYFSGEDSRLLAPAIARVIAPVMEELVAPAVAGLDPLLDGLGYLHLRDQYPFWHSWLSHTIMGEAVRYLMMQGVLPPLKEPLPPAFGHLAWERGAGLLGSGI